MKGKLLWDEDVMLESKTHLTAFNVQGFDFVLIGGWGVYLLTRYHMSRDIDFLMRDRELWKFRSYIQARGGREKSPGIRTYGFVIGNIGVDVYTETKSGLPVDIVDVFEKQRFLGLDGYRVLEPGRLLALKLRAAEARSQSHKGLKDRCDILSICLKNDDYLKRFKAHISETGDENALEKLCRLVGEADIEFEYVLGEKPIPSRIKRYKKDILANLI